MIDKEQLNSDFADLCETNRVGGRDRFRLEPIANGTGKLTRIEIYENVTDELVARLGKLERFSTERETALALVGLLREFRSDNAPVNFPADEIIAHGKPNKDAWRARYGLPAKRSR